MRFEIHGHPIGKARPRVVNGHAYTPERTRRHEETIAWAARIAMAGDAPYTEPIAVYIWFWLHDRRSEPDIDNLVKAVLDGCNGVVFADDKQVVELHAYKGRDREHPRTVVSVGRIAS